jgi:tetratricopeptide (TPR) repeat protein
VATAWNRADGAARLDEAEGSVDPPPAPSPPLRFHRRARVGDLAVPRTLVLIPLAALLLLLGPTRDAQPAPARSGVPGMLQPHTRSLLGDYYALFLNDQNIETFRRNVASRYNEGSLARLLQVGDLQARRASVLALGLYGGFASNAAVARGLRDPDPTVRALADNALWAIWFRADSPENNLTLDRVRLLVNRRQYDDAIELADRLITDAPSFAEAYNQKAIAHFFQGRFAESVEDCKQVLLRNPYHTGALSGMGQGLLQLGRRDEALKTFRQALKIQPYNEGLRETIGELEGSDR